MNDYRVSFCDYFVKIAMIRYTIIDILSYLAF